MLSILISIIHLLLVLFVVVTPFSNLPGLLLLNIITCLSLLLHWFLNNNTCSLTIIESYLRGVNSDQTFIHRIVDPVYSISEHSLNKIIWLVTILSLAISSYKLYSILSVHGFTIKNLFVI